MKINIRENFHPAGNKGEIWVEFGFISHQMKLNLTLIRLPLSAGMFHYQMNFYIIVHVIRMKTNNCLRCLATSNLIYAAIDQP